MLRVPCLLAVAAGADIDVLIVGAGQAGMAAAHRLASWGYSLRVLEATDHVGGRTRNVDLGTGRFDVATDDVIEVGGTWLSPAHAGVLGLCKELGIEVYNASFVGPASWQSAALPGSACIGGGSEEDWPWWFWGSDYPAEHTRSLGRSVFHSEEGAFHFRTPAELAAALRPGVRKELAAAGRAIGDAAALAGSGCWNGSGVSASWRTYDAESTAGFLGAQLLSASSRRFLASCVHGHNAQEPEAVSFLYNLLSFQGCNSRGPDSQYRVRGGTQAIPLAIAALLGSNVSLGDPVTAVRAAAAVAEGEQGIAVVKTRGGREYTARVVIITGPPATVLGLELEPPLPGPQAQLLQRMPMGTSLKLAVVYKEGPWWRELGLQGDILATALPGELSLPEPDAAVPLFVQCMDHSPFSRRFGVIVCFLEGRQNLHFTSLLREKQRELTLAFLKRSFNDSRAETLRPTFVHHNWADQPFARGAYTGFFPPGVLSVPAFWDAYRAAEKLPGVFVAGSDYHIGYGNGYIEGAVRDGQRAAELARARLEAEEERAARVLV